MREAAIEALGDMNGTAVAIDPSNGRILAMVNQKLALSEGATLTAMAGRIVRSLGGEGEAQADEKAQMAERIARYEGGQIEGPADLATAPSEPSMAAAAAHEA